MLLRHKSMEVLALVVSFNFNFDFNSRNNNYTYSNLYRCHHYSYFLSSGVEVMSILVSNSINCLLQRHTDAVSWHGHLPENNTSETDLGLLLLLE